MYDALFSEIRFGNHTLENRIIFRSPATGFARDGKPGAQLSAYYLERAKGGAGLIELEPGLVFDKAGLPAWREFAELIHTYGTKVVAQVGDSDIAETAAVIHEAGLDGIAPEFYKSCRVLPAAYNEPAQCDKLIETGTADLIVLSEQLVCDPYWPMKAQLGREKEIRRFIAAPTETEPGKNSGYITCALNPYLGQEGLYSEHNMTPAAKCKSIVIVGGGPAGIQASITASQRGHNVFLCERKNELGGKMNDSNLADAVTWFIGEMKRNQVDVHLGLPITAEHIVAHKPDVVITTSSNGQKSMIPTLRKKGIQVIEIDENGCSAGRAIRSGFQVAIGL